jgi:hypothetical protein
MKIEEAILSGKPFKRKNFAWIEPRAEVMGPLELTTEDILADDWKTKEEPRTATLYRHWYKIKHNGLTLIEQTTSLKDWNVYNLTYGHELIKTTIIETVEY